jgi:hypothetical protein
MRFAVVLAYVFQRRDNRKQRMYEVQVFAVECFDIAPQVLVTGIDPLAHLRGLRFGGFAAYFGGSDADHCGPGQLQLVVRAAHERAQHGGRRIRELGCERCGFSGFHLFSPAPL